jgi:hypothetical protein
MPFALGVWAISQSSISQDFKSTQWPYEARPARSSLSSLRCSWRPCRRHSEPEPATEERLGVHGSRRFEGGYTLSGDVAFNRPCRGHGGKLPNSSASTTRTAANCARHRWRWVDCLDVFTQPPRPPRRRSTSAMPGPRHGPRQDQTLWNVCRWWSAAPPPQVPALFLALRCSMATYPSKARPAPAFPTSVLTPPSCPITRPSGTLPDDCIERAAQSVSVRVRPTGCNNTKILLPYCCKQDMHSIVGSGGIVGQQQV